MFCPSGLCVCVCSLIDRPILEPSQDRRSILQQRSWMMTAEIQITQIILQLLRSIQITQIILQLLR